MPLIKAVLRYAFEGMRNRPLSHKVGALVVAMVLPLLLLLVLEWQQHQRLIEFSRKELQGLAVVERVADVATHVERLRGAVAAAAARDPNAAAPVAVDVHAKALTQSAQALRAAVANGELADLSKEVDLALQPVARLTQDPQSMARQQFEASHSRAAASLKDFNLRVAERAGLLFDPDAQSYFLMDMLVERLLVLLESSGRSTAATLGVLSTTEASPADRERALALLQHTREHLLHVRGRLEALRRSGGELPGQWPDSYRQVDESAQLARAAVSGETHAADPKEVAAAGGRALHAVELLHAELLRELRGLLEARVQQEGFMQLVSTLLVVLAVLLSSTIAWVFFRSFVGSTKALVKDLELASRGNLSIPVEIRGRDEVAHMGQLVELLCRNMSALVADIRTSATRLGEAGQTVASEGVALARRTDAQAHSLRQSVEVMEHLVGQVTTTADGIQQITELTESLHEQATAGNMAMMTAVQSIDCLQASAKRVAEINGVIDDIAFETNLVALNASVEAAKSGESGRGFAVVAAEIRQLAQRCVAAAAEVRDLIDTTNSQVDVTSTHVQTVGGSLIGLQTGLEQALGRLRLITNASAEQSAGLEEVSAEILSLQGLTQEGAAAVARCEVAAASLLGQASSLSKSVKAVRLRQGGADEAKAMVLHARDLVAAVGWENAADEFNEEHGPWHDRGMYIFAWDDEGVCLAYGVKPQWVGRNIYEFPNGSIDMVEDFLQKAFAILSTPEREGWVDYRQLDANTMVPVAKSAYIVGLAGGGFMGCSVVRNAAEESVDAPCADLTEPLTPAQAEALCASCDQADVCAGQTPASSAAERHTAETV
ncbi:hypothetical protein KAK11_04590 [Ideonella paludis]|uniref:Methyl-accepting chemotaxis protein n=2 Tax=Ideonella paludis TaxID=1233411 RepID=A0ABS5DTX6_9BURK|nr:hypothetical protein [Ideonella paludis]